MIKFDPTIPESESRLRSEPIRTNFNALNNRTDHLTPVATDPATTNVSIGAATAWFEDNILIPFEGSLQALGSSTIGVSIFNASGSFKEVIIYYKIESGTGILGFIESAEKDIRNHSLDTAAELISDPTIQRIPNETTGISEEVPDAIDGISPLDNSIIICSVLVTNNGQTGQQGAINPLFDSDIIDLRPFMHRTFETKSLTAHLDAASLAEAHPNALITNDIIRTISTLTSTNASATADIPVNNTAIFDLGDIVRYVVTDGVTAETVDKDTEFETGSIIDIDNPVGTITLDRQIATIKGDHPVIRGELTLDRMSYDIVKELSDVMQRDAYGDIQLIGGATALFGDVTGTLAASVVSLVGGKTAAQVATAVDDLTTHEANSGIHFTEASISITNSQVSDFDAGVTGSTHAGISGIHFTEASIDHNNILNNGSNDHAAIDTHIADSDIHFDISLLDGYAEKTLLDGYAEKTLLDGYAEKILLDGYAEKTLLDGYAEKILLDGYLQSNNDLSDVNNVSIARGHLDIYSERQPLSGAGACTFMLPTPGSWTINITFQNASGQPAGTAIGWPSVTTSSTAGGADNGAIAHLIAIKD